MAINSIYDLRWDDTINQLIYTDTNVLTTDIIDTFKVVENTNLYYTEARVNSNTNVLNGATAFSWGNHASANYLLKSGGTMTGTLILNGNPTNTNDAVNKAYVDNLIYGLTWKAIVNCATTSNITLSGEQTIDGILTSASRVLVKNQTSASQNGIYLTGSGAWTRTVDADSSAELIGATVLVDGGTLNNNTQWTCSNTTLITIGTTSITFVQIAGVGTYSAGTGLTLTGNVFSISSGAITNSMLAGSIDLTTKVIGLLPDTNISSASNWNSKQNGSPNLTNLAGLTYTSGSPFVKLTGVSTFTLDTNTYALSSSLNSYLLLTGGSLSGSLSGTTIGMSGNINGASLSITGGTSSQFLKANGTVDTNTYALNSSLSGYVDLTTNQSISGIKTFSSDIIVNSNLKIGKGGGINSTLLGVGALNVSTGSGNTAIGQSALLANSTGNNNTAIGLNTLYSTTTGVNNIAVGAGVLGSNITGSQLIGIGNGLDVTSSNLTNAIGIGYFVSLTDSNSVVLGNTSITNVKTSGTLTLGTITYPNTDGISNQVLTTNGSGSLSWSTVSVSGFLPLTGGTLTGTLTSSSVVTTGQPTFIGLTNSTSDTLNFRYTEQAITNIVADTWQMRIGGTSTRRFAITNFDTFEYINMSGSASSNAIVNIPSTTSSISTSTGALVIGGGLGVGGSIYATSLIKSGGVSSQFLKADGSVDSNTYLTSNQIITISGDISGSGTTSIVTAIGAGKVTNAMLAGSIDLTTKVTGVLPPNLGGTGVSNNPAFTITLGGTFTTTNNVFIGSSNHTINLATTNNTSIILPITGTLSTLAGTETLSNKTLTTPTIASIKGTLTTGTDGATITFNKNTSDFHNVTLGGNRTLALSNMATGDRIVIRLVQDATGSRTVTWFTTIKWAGGVAPTLTTTANKADVFGFLCTSSGSSYEGFVIGQNI